MPLDGPVENKLLTHSARHPDSSGWIPIVNDQLQDSNTL